MKARFFTRLSHQSSMVRKMALGALGLATILMSSAQALAPSPELSPELQAAAQGKMLLIDFTSSYCGTCKMMAPYVESLKQQTSDKMTVLHIDVSRPENTRYLSSYHISGTPTYVLYNTDGKPVYRMDTSISPSILQREVLQKVGE